MSDLFHSGGPEQFRDMIAAQLGLRFDDSKLGILGELLQRRADALGLPVDSYLAQLERDPAEAGLLAEELTVGETYFFRNIDQFRAFSEIVLPHAMAARGADQRLSILSAGCSSGEEPFTIAMLARTALPMPPWQLSIRAIDLNPAALRKAASGRYGGWALRETPAEMRERWFTPAGRDLLIDPGLRASIRFDRRNLADPTSDIWQAGAYDAIFCRNVLMYFTPAIQQAVVARITNALAPGGYLFLGHAETLRGLSQDFHLVHTHDTFYYQRRPAGERSPALPAGVEAVWPAVFAAAPLPTPGAPDIGWYAAIGDASRRIEALTRPAEPAPPEIPQWSLAVALDLLQRERFAEALDRIAGLPPAAAEDPDVLLLEALLLLQHGRLDAAVDVCRTLLARDELHAGANYVLALCFDGRGDSAAAINHYGVASYLDPEFAMPLLRRGLLARRAGALGDARRDLAQALDLLLHEDTSRLLLFGGGFTRAALSRLCASELRACEVAA